MMTPNDIRYRAHCFKCKTPIGDWALKLRVSNRRCWEHREWSLPAETQEYSNRMNKKQQEMNDLKTTSKV